MRSETLPQSPVTFVNRSGLRLFGILHQGDSCTRHDVAVLLLCPGVKMRVGPQRLYRRLSQHLSRLGFTVLRFDFFGLGDSEGNLSETLLKDVYNHIEVGRFVDDTIDACDWLQKTTGIKRFLAAGLCGGAVTGLLARSDPRIVGLVALGITPLLASQSADPSLYMTKAEMSEMRSGYLRKLWSPTAWLRLLSFRSDYRIIWRSVTDLWSSRPQSAEFDLDFPPQDNASPLFPQAFFDMLGSGRPMLLLFGGSDRLHWEFQEKFVSRHGRRLATLAPLFETHTIENANHTLSFAEWQHEMLHIATQWLSTHFPDSRAVRETGATSRDVPSLR